MEHSLARPDAGPRRGALIAGFAVFAALLGLGWQAALQVAPTHLSISLLGFTLTTSSVHEHINNAALIFLLLPAALWIECLVVGWTGSSARQLLFARTPSTNSDLACFLLGQAHVIDIAGRLLMLGATMISGAAAHDWLASAAGVDLELGSLPLALQVLACFWLMTFFDYWTHRLDHAPLFWPLHRYHHAARDFAVVTSVRQHPAHFTAIFIINVPMAVLGATAGAMIYVNVLVVSLGFLIHSKIDSDWGWIGRYVIQSPTHHRLHHKLDMSHPTGHFSMAPIWDRLFGTWYGDADQSLPIGVATPYSHGYFVPADMARDYLHFWWGLFGGRNDGPGADIAFLRRLGGAAR